MIGAGGQAGQSDAANLLKPALARGELRTIAATTWAEYKKYFEKDAALARRFQVVKVEEPTEDDRHRHDARRWRRLEKHHGGAHPRRGGRGVASSSRTATSPAASCPTSAVSVLDTACARVAISQAATPAPIEDCRRRIDQLDGRDRVLEREAAAGADHAERLEKIEGRARPKSEARLAA